MVEQLIIYGVILGFCGLIVFYYLRKMKQVSDETESKIEQAKQDGLFEPVSLHPVIDLGTCIKSGACVTACPEHDILGIMNGRGTLINASNCVGHGACFHACPVEAISLVIGTEKRGVDLPHVNQDYETNVPGIYIAGELGGMGLIKNSVEQGQAAVDSIVRKGHKSMSDLLDVVIIGAGPAGIAASLTAKKHQLNFVTLEQDSLGGTVFTFPRSKIVMTSPMDLPLHGKVKLFDTSKSELLDLWTSVLSKNQISIREHTKVESIVNERTHFVVNTGQGEVYKTQNVVIAIGRRGSPRKLGVPGEMSEKVAYRLLEPEMISGKRIMVVGGGDSAIESALLLADQNQVTLSYRSDSFARAKPKNRENIAEAIRKNSVDVRFNTNPTSIEADYVLLSTPEGEVKIPNDQVYIFAGGELPTDFLKNAGIEITKRFGYTVKSYRK